MDNLFAFVVAALALIGSPGPNTLSLAAVGAAFGFRKGLGFLAGLVLGMVGVIALVVSGLVSLLFLVPGADRIIPILAAGYFLYLAYRIATAPPVGRSTSAEDAPSWMMAAMISLSNPKAYAAMGGMISGFVLLEGSWLADTLAKSALLVTIIIAVNLAWLTVGHALTPFLTDPKRSRILNIGFAILLILSVLAIVDLG